MKDDIPIDFSIFLENNLHRLQWDSGSLPETPTNGGAKMTDGTVKTRRFREAILLICPAIGVNGDR